MAQKKNNISQESSNNIEKKMIEDLKVIKIEKEFRQMIENLIKCRIIKEAQYGYEIGVAIAIANGLKWSPSDEKKPTDAQSSTANDQTKYTHNTGSIHVRLKQLVEIYQSDMPPYRCIEGLTSMGLSLLKKDIPTNSSVSHGSFKASIDQLIKE